MGVVEPHFFDEVLRHFGAPIDETNVKALIAWQVAEGGSATWNPFNTTEPAPGATDYNGSHVRNYPDENTGILATIRTLENGHYAGILQALRNGSSGLAVCAAIDHSVWGTKEAEAVYRSRYPNAS